MKSMHIIIIIISILTLIYVCNNYKLVKNMDNYIDALPSTWKPKDIGASCECFREDMKNTWEYTYNMGNHGECKFIDNEKHKCENLTKPVCDEKNGKWNNKVHCEGNYKNVDISGVIDNAPWTKDGKNACKLNTKKCVSGDNMTEIVQYCEQNDKGEDVNCEDREIIKKCQKDTDCGTLFYGQYWKDRIIPSDTGIADRGHRTGASLRENKF